MLDICSSNGSLSSLKLRPQIVPHYGIALSRHRHGWPFTNPQFIAFLRIFIPRLEIFTRTSTYLKTLVHKWLIVISTNRSGLRASLALGQKMRRPPFRIRRNQKWDIGTVQRVSSPELLSFLDVSPTQWQSRGLLQRQSLGHVPIIQITSSLQIYVLE